MNKISNFVIAVAFLSVVGITWTFLLGQAKRSPDSSTNAASSGVTQKPLDGKSPAGSELHAEAASAEGRNEYLLQKIAKLGGEHYKPLKAYMDFPGIDSPKAFSLDEASLVDATPVIGVEYDGRAFAFLEETMADPKAHVVNFNVDGKKSISVTYCSLADCVRVFSSDGAELIPLGVGGLDEDNALVLLHDGRRYGHVSEAIPLAEYPFKRTSLGEWKKIHPKTNVYIPPSRASIEHRRTRNEPGNRG